MRAVLAIYQRLVKNVYTLHEDKEIKFIKEII